MYKNDEVKDYELNKDTLDALEGFEMELSNKDSSENTILGYSRDIKIMLKAVGKILNKDVISISYLDV